MPVVASEATLFPHDLLTSVADVDRLVACRDVSSPEIVLPTSELDDPLSAGPAYADLVDAQRNWWVVYTRSRREKALGRDLLEREIPFYLPVVRKTRRVRGRKVTSRIPLFAGYVFLYGTDDERVGALKTNHVSRLIPVSDEDQLQRDLLQLSQLLRSDAPVTPESRLEAGQRVRVMGGPLLGLEGTVLTRHGQQRLLVAVDFLQQGASVEIDDFMLEPVD